MKKMALLAVCFFSAGAFAQSQVVLTDLAMAKALQGEILSADHELGVAVTRLSENQLHQLSALTHFQNKCGGFEVLSSTESKNSEKVLQNLRTVQSRMHLGFC